MALSEAVLTVAIFKSHYGDVKCTEASVRHTVDSFYQIGADDHCAAEEGAVISMNCLEGFLLR